ncbi:MAG TPA: amidohydrolase [Bacteroidales bacterium]|nr:amidohydrolase [Bacteroidales bacterium]
MKFCCFNQRCMFIEIPTSIETKLVDLRKTLHRHPELSGKEFQTASRIKKFLWELHGFQITEKVGGNGLIAVFDSGVPGPSVLLRCDMDALPIQESNDFAHRSVNDGVAHKCGHDGHMAVMAGVAAMLSANPISKGKIALLFQPEEENGRGAERVLNDEFFQAFKPDWVFAMHNLPGFKESAVVSREGCFASASQGLIVKLFGATSHAAHPEQGRSPEKVVSGLLTGLCELPYIPNIYDDFCLVTIIHARMGERAFGTTPEEAVVMATLRSYLDSDMNLLTKEVEKLVKNLCDRFNIEYEIEYTEIYPATNNDKQAHQMVMNAAKANGLELLEIHEPFRWSEDFGRFTQKYPGAVFGIGVGENHPGLHNNDYDFNDKIIPKAVAVFMNIIKQVHG